MCSDGNVTHLIEEQHQIQALQIGFAMKENQQMQIWVLSESDWSLYIQHSHEKSSNKSSCLLCNLIALRHSRKRLKKIASSWNQTLILLSLQLLPCSNRCPNNCHKSRQTPLCHPFLRVKPSLHIKQNPRTLRVVGRSTKWHLIISYCAISLSYS